ncbi:MAG: MTH1187 family thiamine-binding protein [Zestosphaera sp.]
MLGSIRVVPVGTQSASLSSYVAEALRVIEAAGLKHQVTPFGTAVEADSVEGIAKVVEEIAERLRAMGVPRLVVDVSLDLRFDKNITLEYKVRSVQERLQSASGGDPAGPSRSEGRSGRAE